MNTENLLSKILAGGAGSGLAGGLAGGLASGLLTSRAGRKLAGKALELGGLAAIAGLAYTAWRRSQQGAAAAAGPAEFPVAARIGLDRTPEAFLPGPEQADETSALARALLFAMVAAARADGKLDGDERRAISDGLERLGLSDAERAQLHAALERPSDLEWLVAQATTPERAAEIYAVSLLAIEVDTPAERAYLAMLAARLALPEELVASLHREAQGEAEPLRRCAG